MRNSTTKESTTRVQPTNETSDASLSSQLSFHWPLPFLLLKHSIFVVPLLIRCEVFSKGQITNTYAAVVRVHETVDVGRLARNFTTQINRLALKRRMQRKRESR